MKILFVIGIMLITFFVIRAIVKSKMQASSTENEDSNYSNEAIQILKRIFKTKNFYQNTDLLDLKNKLEIKESYKKELDSIIPKSKHRIDIQYEHNINANKPYSDFAILKTSANEVIDYCVKNSLSIKDAIMILFLIITNEKIKENLDEEIKEEELIAYFYELLPSFDKKYNERINE